MPTDFTVTDEADLQSAIDAIDVGGTSAAANTNYQVTFAPGLTTANPLTLSSSLDAINLTSGDTLTIDGAGGALDGANAYRGLFVYSGAVTIKNLTIQNAVARGGAASGGGGGGAGLGGGVFVAAAGKATLIDVGFTDDAAVGGTSFAATGAGVGAGIGLKGNGFGVNGANGAGGYTGFNPNRVGPGAAGGAGGAGGNGGTGGMGGSFTPLSSTKAGAGGAGGVGGFGGGGGLGGAGGASNEGGNGGVGGLGGFGGGGGVGGDGGYGSNSSGRADGGSAGVGGSGNFGGGGGGGGGGGSAAVFVGVGGADAGGAGGLGGFGGGSGGPGKTGSFGTTNAGQQGQGGGGLGAGGDIFVQQGGSLTIEGGDLDGGAVVGGGGANDGQAYGGGIFLQGTGLETGALAGQTVTYSGVIADEVGSGATKGAGGVTIADPGTVVLAAANTYTDGTTVDSGTLELASQSATGSGGIAFVAGAGATLQLDDAALEPGGTYSTALTGLDSTDVVDLRALTFAPGATATYDPLTHDLDVTSGGITDTLTSPGTTQNFTAKADGFGGTEIVVCFATGTRIRVAGRGAVEDVPVESLAVGDRAVTASGAIRRITWIGRRTIGAGEHHVPFEAWPVRILAGAFGVGACGGDLPERDLRLSPGHPVLVGSGSNEVLVPIMCLINGTSIARVPVDTVTYWHVELDAHDILLAEGLPAESFLEFGNRPWFEGGSHALHDPDLVVPGLAGRCRPVALDGPLVEAERRRLDALFAMRLGAQGAWPEADTHAI